MKKFVVPALLIALSAGSLVSVASAKVSVPVAKGAKVLSASEKADVTGRCGCGGPAPEPLPSKPGYGFGTTGHYGPPGQGFTPENNWRNHAAGDGLTPTGRPLPPRAFK